jgi:pimeloyl-ACP methyl ester carboxylesterase
MQSPHSDPALPSVAQSGIAAVNGARVYYETYGAGAPLVLLHAGIADRRQWDDQIAAFAQHHLVIRYDHRGWGRSDAPAGPVAFHEDLYGLLCALGIARARVLGISMGGTMAIDFALAHPDMVDALILVGSWLSGFPTEASPAEEAVWQAYEGALRVRDFDRANRLEVDLKLAGIYRTSEQVAPAVRERLLAIHRDAFDRLDERERMRPWLKPEPPAAARLGEIRAPTLVIYGDLDVPAVSQIASHLEREIAGARAVVIRGTAHVPNMERPHEFNRLVLDFLAGEPQRREGAR